ncbi:MAG: Deoxyuridine 5'-triphosphate nucleotidohydrolase [Eubacteriales bacterium SKADARSKE-1]|nr:Deoxyuridine 5'-triphosphate nucleotidohydrolase [Eubacteriales bacterium SKADARSKE-1]
MNQNEVAIVKKRNNAKIPYRATTGSAGLDLCAAIDESIIIAPGDLVSIPSGIAIALPNENYVALIFARSGLGVKYGITLSNGVGVIDSDYRGEIFVGLCNLSKEPYEIIPGERIAQLIFFPLANLNLLPKDNLDPTDRNEKRFGSTGK